MPEDAIIAADAVCLIAPPGRVVAGSRAFFARFPASSDGGLLGGIVDESALKAALAQFFAGGEELTVELPPGLDGQEGPIPIKLTKLEGLDGPLALLAVGAAAPLAVRDALTGLPDRRAISVWVARHAALATPFAALFVDLDDFKLVNDQLGHVAGDRVLADVAGRLAQCVRDGDLVTRYGGDEFVILLRGVATAGEVAPIRQRLWNCIAQPTSLDERVLQVSGTIGVALAADGSESIDELIDRADRDMYAAKQLKRK